MSSTCIWTWTPGKVINDEKFSFFKSIRTPARSSSCSFSKTKRPRSWGFTHFFFSSSVLMLLKGDESFKREDNSAHPRLLQMKSHKIGDVSSIVNIVRHLPNKDKVSWKLGRKFQENDSCSNSYFFFAPFFIQINSVFKTKAAKAEYSQHRLYKFAHATPRFLENMAVKNGTMEISSLVVSWYRCHNIPRRSLWKSAKFLWL